MWYTFRGDLLARGFGQKIVVFLNKNAAVTDYAIRGMKTWLMELAIGGATIPLFTIEDDEGAWPDPSCKHYRIASKVMLENAKWDNLVRNLDHTKSMIPQLSLAISDHQANLNKVWLT
ncbi:hypothetical protein RchiOBHm_Chr2g0092501 [Rosa chinensis]|uniref:Uncharacterized protein n=1 Tax=Rosa chinensis TaxID=74649 RepID=A0A2P6RK40_ROSCH|nr:hypothetical protein RchiOBHm_Chr2g0092501 [Rosa chinensis]